MDTRLGAATLLGTASPKMTNLNPPLIDVPGARPPRRGVGLDALRAAMTLLVVMHHAAITYGAIGGWFYKEVAPDGSLSSKILIFFCTFNQAFFMGLFFLLAGYFTPSAMERRGVWAYLRDRFWRLGLPLLLFGFVIGPATIALAQTAEGRGFTDTFASLLRQGEFERGPLWFCQALLIFACAAALVHVWAGRRKVATGAHTATATATATALGMGTGAEMPMGMAPAEMRIRPPSQRQLLVAALATGAAAFLVRLWWPVGTQWWGLQLGYFPGYVTLFWGGYLVAAGRWLERLDAHQVQTWRRVRRWTLPVLPVLALAAPAVPLLQGAPEGGWHVLAAVYAFWEPLVAWGVILGLLWRFQHQVKADTWLWRSLAERAYTIFVVHAPVLVAVALAWRQIEAPPLVKFLVTGVVSCWISYWVAGGWLWLWRRVVSLRRGETNGAAAGR